MFTLAGLSAANNIYGMPNILQIPSNKHPTNDSMNFLIVIYQDTACQW